MQNSILSEKPSLLIVDDDPTVIQIIIEFLEDRFLLSVAKSRSRALDLLQSKQFDLVLLDVNLPDGNGIEICREIKSSREYSDSLVIIFMTSHYSTELEAQGLSVGANDYIYKPVNRDVLLARINLQLNQIRKTKLLAHLAKVDGLTEIGNRRAFDEQLTQEWFRAKREGKNVALLLIDIDYFKQYNDTYGHPAGDKCLQNIAHCLTSSFKRHSDFCFRIGGEEFAVILYDMTANNAKTLIQEMRENIHNLNILHQTSPISDRLTISAGIYDSREECRDANALLDKSDHYLYMAKRDGRNKVKSPDF